jgi:hypothetical protein
VARNKVDRDVPIAMRPEPAVRRLLCSRQNKAAKELPQPQSASPADCPPIARPTPGAPCVLPETKLPPMGGAFSHRDEDITIHPPLTEHGNDEPRTKNDEQ